MNCTQIFGQQRLAVSNPSTAVRNILSVNQSKSLESYFFHWPSWQSIKDVSKKVPHLIVHVINTHSGYKVVIIYCLEGTETCISKEGNTYLLLDIVKPYIAMKTQQHRK